MRARHRKDFNFVGRIVVRSNWEALTRVRDLGDYRRTLNQGDEINVDLGHWR